MTNPRKSGRLHALARRSGMPPLPRLQRAVRRGPPFDAVPLPRLRQALFRAHRQRDGRHQARLPHPGRRPVPAYHRHSGRLEHDLGRYLTEFTGRCNDRDCDTAEQMRRMARGLVGKTPTYRQLTGKAAVAARAAPSAPSAAARCRRTLHARCASRSVRGARRIWNPPARPESGPDHPCRPSSAGDPLSSALGGHAIGLQAVPSTANRIPPGMRGGLSNPCLVNSAGRFDSDTIPPCCAYRGRIRMTPARRRPPCSEQFSSDVALSALRYIIP